MIKQYHILNDCLTALKGNDHDTGTLQIEIQLYRLKRLLLKDEVAERLRNDYLNEKEFKKLRDRVLHYGNDGRSSTEVLRILSQISELVEHCTR